MANFVESYNRLKHDSQVAWRPGRIVLPVINFSGLLGTAGVATGSGVGAPVTQEISSFAVVGLLMDNAADEISTYMVMPDDMDLSKRIYCRVHWCSGSTDTADTVTWKVWYKGLVENVTAILAVGDSGGVALDKVIAADDVPVATAYAWAVTEEGFIDAGKIPENTVAFIWTIEMDAIDGGLSENVFPLALEIRYTPKRLWGPSGMLHEAKATNYIAGKSQPI